MVLDLLVIGLAITVYPLPILAFVLVLSAPRGVWKGLAFILAWLANLVAVIAIVLLLTGGQPPPPRSPPSTAAIAVKLALGVGLIVYSEHRRRRFRSARATAAATAATTGAANADGAAPADSEAASGSSPTSRLDQASAWSAATVAVLLQPWGMVGLAAATVVQADLSHGGTFLALLGFCLLATASLLAMELYTVFAPDRAQRALADLRAWLKAHKDPAIIVTCLVLGLWMTARSLAELTG
ncbi:GAP family protein [Streptomyces sp. NPDC002054]|uniref:GAP family protein n=1 Tax=Streptomyces sp. NPDC002054 TaxID=3154663 RepID=UPI00331FBABA